jgi:ABC-2 type transport system permease protein
MPLLRSREKEPETQNEAPATTVLAAGSGSAASQNARNIPLIISREYKARVQKRGFVIATIFMVVLVIAAAFIPTLIEVLSSNSQTKLTIVNNAGTVAGQDVVRYLENRLNINYDNSGQPIPLAPNKKPNFDIKTAQPDQINDLRKQVQDGKLDVVLVTGRNQTGDLTFDYYSNSSTSGLNTNLIQLRSIASELSFLDKLTKLGVPQSQLGNLFQAPQFKASSSTEEKNGRTPAETGAAYTIALAGIILIFSSIQIYGAAVAQGAVEEKSNRVMEIIVNAATPFQLMIGKIAGIGLAGITQMGIMVVFGLAAFLAQGPIKSALLGNATGGTSIDITGLSLGLLGVVLLYFVLGFLLYASLYAAVGSLVSRMEDVQNALGPLTFVFMAAYIASVFALNLPDAPWVVVLSYVPFFTPTMMLVRLGVGSLAWWEIPLSAVIMVVTVIVMIALASRVYRAGVLMYGQKPSFRKVLSLMLAR